jgi:hypothetical protein
MEIRPCISVSLAHFQKKEKRRGGRKVDGNRSSKWSVLYFLAWERQNKQPNSISIQVCVILLILAKNPLSSLL